LIWPATSRDGNVSPSSSSKTGAPGAAPLRLDAVLNGQPGAVDAYNARVIEANRATPAAELLERAEDTCDELAAAIGGLSDAE
jgi:hypothetical protein